MRSLQQAFSLCSTLSHGREVISAMPSARFFQQIMDVLKQWWLAGFQINDQYALTDDCARDLLRYCSAYASKTERQERGSVHIHVMLWRAPTSASYVERVPPVRAGQRRECESGAEGVGR